MFSLVLLRFQNVIESFISSLGIVIMLSLLIPNEIPGSDYIAFNASLAVITAAVQEFLEALGKIFLLMPLAEHLGIFFETESENAGGQRQRLLLARALVGHPEMLVLDEATSALDNLTQKHVLEEIYSEKCTVIMVAHRLTTVRNCDRIIVLKHGKIEEEGNYDELISRRGAFYNMMSSQT